MPKNFLEIAQRATREECASLKQLIGIRERMKIKTHSRFQRAMIFTETGKLDQEKIKMLVLAQDKVSYLQFDFHIEKFGIPSQILKLAENRIVVFLKIDIISKDVI